MAAANALDLLPNDDDMQGHISDTDMTYQQQLHATYTFGNTASPAVERRLRQTSSTTVHEAMPMRSVDKTPESSSLQVVRPMENAGNSSSGSTSSLLQRAQHDAVLASSRNKSAMSMTDTQLLNDSLKNQHQVLKYHNYSYNDP